MKIPRTPQQKAEEREAARQSKRQKAEEKKKLQCRGYGFSHRIPARAIPSSILEMQDMVHCDGSPLDGYDAKSINRFRRELRAARI